MPQHEHSMSYYRKIQRMQEKNDVKGLLEALNNDNADNRRSAAYALSRIASRGKASLIIRKGGIPKLMNIYSNDFNQSVASTAFSAIVSVYENGGKREILHSGGMEFFMSGFRSPSWGTRTSAAKILKFMIKDGESQRAIDAGAANLLIDCMIDDDVRVRKEALHTISAYFENGTFNPFISSEFFDNCKCNLVSGNEDLKHTTAWIVSRCVKQGNITEVYSSGVIQTIMDQVLQDPDGDYDSGINAIITVITDGERSAIETNILVPFLLERLQDSDRGYWDDINHALHAIGNEVIEPIIEILKSGFSHGQEEMKENQMFRGILDCLPITLMKEFDNSLLGNEVLPCLLDLLQHNDVTIREKSVVLLGKLLSLGDFTSNFGGIGISNLFQTITDPPYYNQYLAVWALGELVMAGGGKLTIDNNMLPTLNLYLESHNPLSRKYSANVILKLCYMGFSNEVINSKGISSLLRGFLGNEDRMGDVLHSSLHERNYRTEEEWCHIAIIGMNHLIHTYLGEFPDNHKNHTGDDFQNVLQYLRSTDPIVRCLSAWLIGWLALTANVGRVVNSGAVVELIRMARDSSSVPENIAFSVGALGMIAWGKEVDIIEKNRGVPLIISLTEHTDNHVRSSAYWALAGLSGRQRTKKLLKEPLIDIYIRGLRDPYHPVRYHAVQCFQTREWGAGGEAIIKGGGISALMEAYCWVTNHVTIFNIILNIRGCENEIISQLGKEDPRVRWLAAHLLSSKGVKDSIGLLEELLSKEKKSGEYPWLIEMIENSIEELNR